MEVTVIPIIIGALGTIPKRLVKRTSGDHLDYNITKIGQDIEKSPEDVLSQTTV